MIPPLALGLCLLLPQEAKTDPAPEPDLFQTLLKKVTLGGQVRLRAEYRDPVGYANDAQLREDDDFLLSRIRLNLTLSLYDDLDIFVQPQDSRTFGEESSLSSNEKNLDLHQGYVEARNLGGVPITLKAGRQELQYGDGRLVSVLDWNNVARAWDGVKIRFAPKDGWIDAFYTIVKEGNGAEDDQDFFGLYGSYTGIADHELDLCLLRRRFADNPVTDESGRKGDFKDTTFGLRVKGRSGAASYSLEGAWQTGSYSTDDVSAWAVAANLGIAISMEWKPSVILEYTFASGDDDPADGDRGTFDAPYPFGHAYQGYADVFSWKNGHSLSLKLSVKPEDAVSIHADGHLFRLDEERDAWYGASGSAIRRDTTGDADRNVGSEIDLHVRWGVTKEVKVWAGWSHFFAGPYVDDTGRDRDMDWVFLQATIDF